MRIIGPGTGLVWPALDVAHDIPGLIDGVFGTRRHMAEIARAGGSKKSAAKAKAAKETAHWADGYGCGKGAVARRCRSAEVNRD